MIKLCFIVVFALLGLYKTTQNKPNTREKRAEIQTEPRPPDKSADSGREIALRYTDRVFVHPWCGFGPQKQAAVELARHETFG